MNDKLCSRWFFETIAFLSGLFGPEKLAAYTICYSLLPLFFMFPLGVGCGITVRCG